MPVQPEATSEAEFFERFDKAVDELEESWKLRKVLGEVNFYSRNGAQKGGFMNNSSTFNDCDSVSSRHNFSAVRQYDDLETKAFLQYIASGDCLNSAGYEHFGSAEAAQGCSRSGGFSDFSHCSSALSTSSQPSLCRGIAAFDTKSHLLSRDDSGGYKIPHHSLGILDQQMKVLCPLRSLAKVSRIRGNALNLLLDKNAADAGWGISFETAPGDGGTQDLTQLQIPVHRMYARPRTTQKILDDVGEGLEEWILTKISQKMAALENHAFLFGDGQNKPKGILAHQLADQGCAEWGRLECVEQISDKDEISRAALLDLVGLLKSEFLPNASWLMSRSALISIQNIQDGQGRFLWQQSLTSGAPSSLLGFPVFVSDDMPQLNGGFCLPVLFGDFKAAYQIVDRGDVSVLRDPYSAKPFVEFFVTKRVGGDVVNFDALKVLKLCTAQ